MNIMEVSNLSFTYPEGKKILHAMNLTVCPGEFLLLCGPSGCGKTTFLRCLKKQIAPVGSLQGSVTELAAADVGFVFQNPDSQIVTDTVRHELAFGLENIGLPTEVIRRRVAETALFFGIQEWIDRQVHEISGGQKQLLNLASVIAMRPKLLLLDEPVSQLDPSARKNFLELLSRVNRELGIAVILSEHQLKEVLPLSDRVLYMKDGRFLYEGTAEGYARYMLGHESEYADILPAAARIAYALEEGKSAVPLTVREGRDYMESYVKEAQPGWQNKLDYPVPQKGVGEHGAEDIPSYVGNSRTYIEEDAVHEQKLLFYADHIWFQYDKQMPYVLKGLELPVREGECHMILGGNGSGKTTLLLLLGKRLRADRGKIRTAKGSRTLSVGLLVQSPKAMFSRDTVLEELEDAGTPRELRRELKLLGLLAQHPYDLSGGEQQRLALALVLTGQPDLLLLDEPVKGMDAGMRQELGEYLRAYAAQGHTVVCVTHDVDFAARYGDICSLLFEGEVLSTGPAENFFRDNVFYTTDSVRILRGFIEEG